MDKKTIFLILTAVVLTILLLFKIITLEQLKQEAVGIGAILLNIYQWYRTDAIADENASLREQIENSKHGTKYNRNTRS